MSRCGRHRWHRLTCSTPLLHPWARASSGGALVPAPNRYLHRLRFPWACPLQVNDVHNGTVRFVVPARGIWGTAGIDGANIDRAVDSECLSGGAAGCAGGGGAACCDPACARGGHERSRHPRPSLASPVHAFFDSMAQRHCICLHVCRPFT